ncbi:MAG TPA: hypothetical protein VNW99_09615, partial [Cytophagaceae bacterium]|nr:hypothetical protein [Cytophagaceae bacterium]
MSEEKMMRLSQVARNLNVGTSTIAEHLAAKGFNIENNPNSKITVEQYNMLLKEFESSASDKKEAANKNIGTKRGDSVVIKSDFPNSKKNKDEEEEIFIKNLSTQSTQRDKDETAQKEIKKKAETEKEAEKEIKEISIEEDTSSSKVKLQGIKVVGKIELGEKKTTKSTKTKEEKVSKKTTETPEIIEKPVKKEEKEKPAVKEKEKKEKVAEKEPEKHEEEVLVGAKADTLKGLTVLGKIELPEKAKKKEDGIPETHKNKKKRKRVRIGLQKGESKPGGPATVNPPRIV